MSSSTTKSRSERWQRRRDENFRSGALDINVEGVESHTSASLRLFLKSSVHAMLFNGTVGSTYYAFPEKFVKRPSQSSSTNFKSLKSLSLKCVNLTREAIEFFLHNCPLLENLVVHFTNNISSLVVCAVEFQAGIVGSKFPQLPELKKLVVDYQPHDKESLLELAHLMKACPYLQEFVLQSTCAELPRLLRRKVKSSLKLAHEQLKVFKFLGYCGSRSDVEFVRYILDNCRALEKLIIDHHFQFHFSNFSYVSQHPDTLDLEQSARTNAKLQLEPLVVVSHHIDFVIL
ncbi:hypothetical protein MIMGU_mgv1a011262mg [Erythranthe guttata]|uniref:At1g61320/AtMIF1 LRR domain-containing protein n=1 Tax=Erythranthe guttata TaxID=4155 RepID=A0A022RPW7_ERYGU|nr:hypothetical protein MIMGU_mgv1a011262mg [Erythranthe guttata]